MISLSLKHFGLVNYYNVLYARCTKSICVNCEDLQCGQANSQSEGVIKYRNEPSGGFDSGKNEIEPMM